METNFVETIYILDKKLSETDLYIFFNMDKRVGKNKKFFDIYNYHKFPFYIDISVDTSKMEILTYMRIGLVYNNIDLYINENYFSNKKDRFIIKRNTYQQIIAIYDNVYQKDMILVDWINQKITNFYEVANLRRMKIKKIFKNNK
jgi:hypothetical protein